MAEKLNWAFYGRLVDSEHDLFFARFARNEWNSDSVEEVSSGEMRPNERIYICIRDYGEGISQFEQDMVTSMFDDFCSNYIHRNGDFRNEWLYDSSFSVDEESFKKSAWDFVRSLNISRSMKIFEVIERISSTQIAAIEEYERRKETLRTDWS